MHKNTTRGIGLSFAMAFVGLLGGGLLAGVVSSCGAADEAFDCQAVCSKYKECINDSYDVGKCRSDCRDKAANNTDFKRKADTCHACISDRSCTGSTFNCTDDCLGIVP